VKTKVSKNLSNIQNSKTTIDNKLAFAQMNINWAFEYGVNFTQRTITWSQGITFPMFDIIDAALTIMEAESGKGITLRLNSPGGDTYEAMAVIGRLRRSKCNITIEGYGHIMSAATLILASGFKRKIDKNAQFMWHSAFYGVEGKHTEIKAVVKQVEKEEKIWAEEMAKLTNKTTKFWLEKGIHIDYYIDAETLLKYGVVDEIF
jgi:ATP-dependent Clp endopeptidase proteolytic subunit ClpP